MRARKHTHVVDNISVWRNNMTFSENKKNKKQITLIVILCWSMVNIHDPCVFYHTLELIEEDMKKETNIIYI